MSVTDAWRNVAVREGLKAFLSLIIGAAVATAWGAFRSGLHLYNPLILTLSTTLFAALFLYEIVATRQSRGTIYRVGVLYLGAFGVFVALTGWVGGAVGNPHLNLGAAFLVLLLGRLVLHAAYYVAATEEERRWELMGYAVTSVLISEAIANDPQFILVMNRNLRGGNGLWVSPGGHFTPHQDDPRNALLARIAAEVALQAKIFSTTANNLPSVLEDLKTDACEWIAPPAFLLREALFGLCSHQHTSHLDFVYLCVTSGAGVKAIPKYDQSQRVTMPLKRCAESYEETVRAVHSTIDAWYRARAGAAPGRRDDLTADVCWRLHLAAQIYLAARQNIPHS